MNSENRISEFDLERKEYNNDLADVVIKTNEIETLLENLILSELQPNQSNYDFMKNVLFNSAHLSLYAKLKLAESISKKNNWKNLDLSKIHTLLRIRNAFAHTSPVYFRSFKRESLGNEIIQEKDILVVENNRGDIEKKSWRELKSNFIKIHSEIYEPLRKKSREEMKKWGENVFTRFVKS